jgi:hypothetical protein
LLFDTGIVDWNPARGINTYQGRIVFCYPDLRQTDPLSREPYVESKRIQEINSEFEQAKELKSLDHPIAIHHSVVSMSLERCLTYGNRDCLSKPRIRRSDNIRTDVLL